MARKSITGLSQRKGLWHIDKKIDGERLYESTGTSDRQEAERYLIHRLEQLRQEKVYGVRQSRLWREAATRYLIEFKDQPSIELTAHHLKGLDPYIGDVPITLIDDEALEKYIKDKKKPGKTKTGKHKAGQANRTINITIERVIRVLTLCARKWRDDERRPWLDSVPMLKKLETKKSSRKPYPMSWEEQTLLISQLPDHLKTMTLFKVNTGCREQEVCRLRWDWEIFVPEIGASVFLIPEDFGGRHERSGVKNGDDRLVILNDVAKSIVDAQRGIGKEYVFPYGRTKSGKEGCILRMNNSAWRKARVRAAKLWQEKYLRPAHPGYLSVRIHDLKHTYGRRLKAAGVTQEDRKSLLGHKNGSVTSHYSGAEIWQLIEAANKVSATDSRGPVLTILQRRKA